MAESREDYEIVPLPGQDEAERKRIRTSNDRDQARERDGKPAAHNEGYDEAADGRPAPPIERVLEEDA